MGSSLVCAHRKLEFKDRLNFKIFFGYVKLYFFCCFIPCQFLCNHMLNFYVFMGFIYSLVGLEITWRVARRANLQDDSLDQETREWCMWPTREKIRKSS